MAWGKKDLIAKEPVKNTWPGLVLLGISTIIYLFSLFTEVRTFIAGSMYATLIGSLIYLTGLQSVKILFTPLLLLLMLIPIPEQLYPQLTFPLQLQVSKITELIVSHLGIPLLREGNVMHLPDHSFEVVEACSGLRSVITLMTLSVILGFFSLKRPLNKILLFATSIPTAIFVNIIRVSAMILLYHYFKLDLTEGAYHTVTGLLIFCLALFSLFILGKILEQWEK
jgi:exosortase